MPPREAFTEYATRPLFVVSRRPSPPPPAAPPAAKPPAPPPPSPPAIPASNFVLMGIIVGAGAKVAVVKPPNAPAVVDVVEGQTINGWQITQILADRVIMKSSATHEEITFRKQSEKLGTPTPPQAAIKGTLPPSPLLPSPGVPIKRP